jgi:hypothetical protein
MTCWRINTDKNARKDVKTCDIWYREGKAFAGDGIDLAGNFVDETLHYGVFKKLNIGDGIFMHHSGAGIVGYGQVVENWDGKTYTGKNKLLYTQLWEGYEVVEYSIKVKWFDEYDRRDKPIPINGWFPFPAYKYYFSEVDSEKCEKIKKLLKSEVK